MKNTLLLLLLFISLIATAQQASPNNGFLPAKLTTTQINQLSFPATGLLVFDSDDSRLKVNIGTGQTPDWKTLDVSTDFGVGKVMTTESPNNGFLPSRVSSTSGFTNPASGLIVFNTTTFNLQVNIGTPTTPNWKNFVTNVPGSAVPFVANTQENPNQGFLLSRVSDAVRNAFVNPATGLMIFNTTTRTVQVNSGTGIVPEWDSIAFFNPIAPCTAITALTCSGNQSITAGSTATTTATGGTGGVITWAITPTAGVSTTSGTGLSTGTITYSSTGTYTITFTSTNNSIPAGCSPTVTTTCSSLVTVNAAAIPCTATTPFTCSGNTTITAGNNYLANITSSTNGTLSWSITPNPATGTGSLTGTGSNTGNLNYPTKNCAKKQIKNQLFFLILC